MKETNASLKIKWVFYGSLEIKYVHQDTRKKRERDIIHFLNNLLGIFHKQGADGCRRNPTTSARRIKQWKKWQGQQIENQIERRFPRLFYCAEEYSPEDSKSITEIKASYKTHRFLRNHRAPWGINRKGGNMRCFCFPARQKEILLFFFFFF